MDTDVNNRRSGADEVRRGQAVAQGRRDELRRGWFVREKRREGENRNGEERKGEKRRTQRGSAVARGRGVPSGRAAAMLAPACGTHRLQEQARHP